MLSGTGKWLSYRREVPDARLRLFCFPFGGGGASIFTSWISGMPAGIEVCPVQLPGHENRLGEPLITRLPQMVDLLVEALALYLDRPYALFGHSIGALLMFELARQFRRLGLPSPERLFASGHPSPHLPRRRPFISHLTQSEFTRVFSEQFDPDPVLLANKDFMDFIFPILRADYELVETYVYHEQPPFTCPLSVFGGSHDLETTQDELLAWRVHTTGTFKMQILPGKHMFIQTSREALVNEITRDLMEVSILQGRPSKYPGA